MAQNNPETPAIILRPATRRDLEAIFAALSAQNLRRATHFLTAAQQTLLQLGELPHIGSPLDWARYDQRLHSLRRWPISNFRFYQIIYRPLISNDGVVVFRVLHSAQDGPTRTIETLEDE